MAEEGLAAEGTGTEGTGTTGSEGDISTGSEGFSSTQGDGEQAASGSVVEPELYTIKVNGREEQVTFDELLENGMRQRDYTQKTQELAVQREEVAQMRALASALERDPRGTLIALSAAMGVQLGAPAGQVAASGETEDPFEHLARQVQGITDHLSQQSQTAQAAQQQAQKTANINRQIERETADLKAQHGDFDHKALYTYAVEHNADNLPFAYRAWQFDLAEGRRIADLNAATAAKRRGQVVNGGSNPAAGATVPSGTGGKVSVRDAFAMALAAHR